MNLLQPFHADSNVIDAEVQKVIEAGRSVLPPEIWDYIIDNSFQTPQPDIIYSIIQSSTDLPQIVCLPTPSY